MTQVTIKGAQIWDGVSDASYPGTVTVTDTKTTSVTKGDASPDSTSGEVIDGTGHTLMPGMVEGYCQRLPVSDLGGDFLGQCTACA